MKKKLIGVAVIAAIAVAAAWNYNQSKNETSISDLTMANVEALAYWEYTEELYLLHCGSYVGTECQSSITGPSCSYRWSCP